MFELFSTLLKGANARAAQMAGGCIAVEQTGSRARVRLMQLERSEQKALDQLRGRKAEVEDRVREALAAGNFDTAMERATAVAIMENEAALRAHTISRLDDEIMRLRERDAEEDEDFDATFAPALCMRVRAEDVLKRIRTTPAPTDSAI